MSILCERAGASDRHGSSRPAKELGRNCLAGNPHSGSFAGLCVRVYGIAHGGLWIRASYRMCERGQFPARPLDQTNTRNGRAFCLGRSAEPTDPANARRKHAALQPRRITGTDFGLLDSAAPARIETGELAHYAEAPH